MRRSVLPLAALLIASLLPWGCGGNGLAAELTALLERRSGEIASISYVCLTDDGERTYREEFEIAFPDRYRYRFYEYVDGQPMLLNLTEQSGTELYRVRNVPATSDQPGSLQEETQTNIPPIRCTGTYLALYHLVGNVDYFQSVLTLIEGGTLEVAAEEIVEGTDTYRLDSASGLEPQLHVWLDGTTGLPLRKELLVSEGQVVTFDYEAYMENAAYADEPFPPNALALFGEAGSAVSSTAKDGGCQLSDSGNAPAQAGFSPLLPQLSGFELAQVYVRDPAASTLSASEESLNFPEDFREIYLVLRSGLRQVEIRETPYDPDFGYYTASMLGSGLFLTQNEVFGEEAGAASYTAALDCQEMHLTLGGIELMVTGDLSSEEMEALAVQLKELSGSP